MEGFRLGHVDRIQARGIIGPLFPVDNFRPAPVACPDGLARFQGFKVQGREGFRRGGLDAFGLFQD